MDINGGEKTKGWNFWDANHAASHGSFSFCFRCAKQRRGNDSADVRMQDVVLQIVVSIFGLPSLILLLSWKSHKHPGTGLARGCLGSNGKVQQRANSYAQGASRTRAKVECVF